MSSTDTKQPLLKGTWNDNLTWCFYLDHQAPEIELCTSVYCLAIIKETDEIVLTRIKRGWEMLGGHIEPNESLEDTLIRESLEEGGFLPEAYAHFGYIEVTAKEPVANRQGGSYPLVSYIPHFVAITKNPLAQQTGDEVIERGVFALGEIKPLGSAQEAIIHVGMERYATFKKDLAAQLAT